MSNSSSNSYRKLLSNLPSMASVVNSFESPEVQLEVYKTLILALNDQEGSTSSPSATSVRAGAVDENGVVTHDILDGGNIHSVEDDD